MLANYVAIPTVPVADLQRAREFYETVLGLQPGFENEEGIRYDCGGSAFFVYQSSFAGTNKATTMSFQVPAADFDSEVAALRGQGLEFMTFDADGISWNDGIASFGEGIRGLWFEDPDRNIISVETA